MGSVRFNEGRGTWFVDYIAANGERVRQTIGPGEEGKRLARKVLAQREAEAQLGIHHLPPSRTQHFDEVAAAWLERMRPPRVQAKTFEDYEDAVERLLPFFAGKRLGAITREDVEAWLVSGQRARRHHPKQKKEPQPLSVTTMNDTLNILRMILADAVERGALASNPAVKAKPLPTRKGAEGRVQYLTPEQVDRLLAIAQEPYRTLYHLTVNAGLRRGEVLALKWDDLDLANRRLRVRASRKRERLGERYVVHDAAPKTKGSAAVVDELSPSVVQALLALPASDDPGQPYVFRNRAGGPIDPHNLRHAFTRHLKRAGIPPVKFHALRHSTATHLIAMGEHAKAIQARMRHERIGTTMDTYGHLMAGAFQGMGERMDAWFRAQAGAKEGNRKATTGHRQKERTSEPAS
ncbi:MAG: tyrosine-type recombinase/integrase [bacterium]|nr:tyrosine-type recombinase/integrase [bacterium]